jgi:hypothetical protein
MTRALPVTRWLIVAAALLALVLAACSDDEDPGSSGADTTGSSAGSGNDKPAMTEAEAATIAAAALLTVDDLPDAQWEVTESTGPEDPAADDDFFANVPECRALNEVLSAEDSEPLAIHRREFDTAVTPLDATGYSVEVNVFADSAEVETALEDARRLLTPESLGPCFEAAFTESFASESEDIAVEITSFNISEPGFKLDNSVAYGVTMEVGTAGLTFDIALQIHMIGRDQVGASLSIMELNSTLASEHAEATLTAFEERIMAALDAQ